MIFVTTGTQLPFPRLLDAMADLVPELNEEVVAQTGPDPHKRVGLVSHPTLSPAEFETHFLSARVVVAHAGVGSILSARKYSKPMIILPRRRSLREHRNDHQLATARQVEALTGIYVAWETSDLGALLRRGDLVPAEDVPGPSARALINRVRAFIDA